MSRLTKGAIATAAGLTLLLGGAGTFALWNDAVPGFGTDTSITTGHLQFEENSVKGRWYDVSSTTKKGIDLTQFRMVPGDTVEFRGKVGIKASGNNLAARFDVNKASIGFRGTSPLSSDGLEITMTEGGIVSSSDTADATSGVITHSFALRIHWPLGEQPNNTRQDSAIDLKNVQFTLTQQRPAA